MNGANAKQIYICDANKTSTNKLNLNLSVQRKCINIHYSFRDNVPTIRLGAWPLNASLFDGEVAAGPCPILFAEDEETTVAALILDHGKSHYDVMRINRAFLSLESVNLKEATAIVKKPRYI